MLCKHVLSVAISHHLILQEINKSSLDILAFSINEYAILMQKSQQHI